MTQRGWIAVVVVFAIVAFAFTQSNATAARSVDWFFDAVLISQRAGVDIDTGDGMTITGADASTRVDYVFSVDLLSAGADGDSTTTTGDSALEFVGGDLTLLRGCSSNDRLGWVETGDYWQCEAPAATGDAFLTNCTIDHLATANGSGAWRCGGSVALNGVLTASGNIVMNDNRILGLGTSLGEAYLYSNGNDVIWESRNGGISMGIEGNNPGGNPDNNGLHIKGGTVTSSSSIPNSNLTLEDSSDTFFQLFSPTGGVNGIYFGFGSDNDVARIVHDAGSTRLNIDTTIGNIRLNPSGYVDVTGDELLLQNTSQSSSPGTTTNGAIRLWEDSDIGPTTGGRILAQINGTTYQWNADSGLTFENRPARLAADRAFFGRESATWRADELAKITAGYESFDDAHPEYDMPPLAPSWTPAYWLSLAEQYRSAETVLGALGVNTGDIPQLEPFTNLELRQPWPNPQDYKIAHADLDETRGYRTNEPIAEGDTIVLVVDSVETDPVTGEVLSFHVVPSTLAEELLNLLETDPTLPRR